MSSSTIMIKHFLKISSLLLTYLKKPSIILAELEKRKK